MADKREMTTARMVRVRKSGLQIDALNEDLQNQISLLDDDELAVLESVKAKLNKNLPDNLKAAADVVGGFVW
ncbi:aroma-sacti cluster domain-containing protein [Jannaschia rubra]|uniref:Uncharacterized protein n=1 Tax=Jannaschia rubra TaxID=282197 RepID=A0A0M6XV39_9RHOB|nr:aroma-sacti cluster domain-containing protein [Jannaschia rubra]CTQ34602.1 hypothetical protein JAN5088_03398 [Jannaschia rubra]SFG72178.1 hypothetical protein SAMN04488517_11244 [Jannaschia rubra]